MSPRTFAIAIPCVVSCLAAAVAFVAVAGPLDPPSGAVTPTMKTLIEVEPRIAVNAANTPGDNDATPSMFKITQPGSYYLTGNITGASGKIGIEIAAGGVSLDLNGFEMFGVSGSREGVASTTNGVNFLLADGSVRDWGGDGVRVSSLANARVRDLTVSDCTGDGIEVGANASVERCTVSQNDGIGIVATTNATIIGCLVREGIRGINTGSGAVVTSCAVRDSVGDGMNLGGGSTVTGCTVFGCDVSGIQVGAGSTVSACSATSNGVGFELADGCTITGCTAALNTNSGILTLNACGIVGNTCDQNGNAASDGGICVSGTGNRIERNTCTRTVGTGIIVEGVANLVVGNWVRQTTGNAFNIGTGNSCLVVIAARTTGPLIGNSGGASPGSTNPYANFTDVLP